MTTDRLDELIALAALGELTAAEESELDELLATEADGLGELRATLDAVAAVQATLAESPPAALRNRVLAATAGMPQLPALPADDGGVPAAVENVAMENVVTLDSRRRRMGSFLAAVAAAVVLVVGGAVVLTNDRSSTDPIAAVVDAADVTSRTFDGGLGELQMYYSPSEGALVLDGVANRFPSGDNTLELWLVNADGATPVGLFRPDDDGRIEVRFDDVDPTGFVLGVTEEPPGGSETPTLPILTSA